MHKSYTYYSRSLNKRIPVDAGHDYHPESFLNAAPRQALSEASTVLFFFHHTLVLAILELDIIGIIQCALLCKASFAQQNVETHHVVASSRVLSLPGGILWDDYLRLVIHSAVGRFLGSFQMQAIMNKAAMNLLYKSFCGNVLSFLLGKYVGMELLGEKYI